MESLLGSLSRNFSNHFRTSMSYAFRVISLPQGDFVTRLVSWRTEIIFSSKWAWVNLIQYDNVSETAGINSRLEWTPEAGREAFLVINHNVEDFDMDNRFHSTRSDITAKFHYTFRF